MATTHVRKTSKKQPEPSPGAPFGGFWSGVISFGLVSVPVSMVPASRQSALRFRLLSPAGAFLERRFFCKKDGKEVGPDEIVLGHELDDGSYVTVTRSELEDLEPSKSRELTLRAFVDISDVAPMFWERGYYLTPAKEGTKAYRLLAEAMEKSGRSGIGSLVMREREYLVAIFARDGILCAETLRLRDELRDPGTIGLAPARPAPPARVRAYEREIDALAAENLSQSDLVDPDSHRVRTLIERKRRAGKNLIQAPDSEESPEPDTGDDVDLLESIRKSLKQTQSQPDSHSRSSRTSPGKKAAGRRRKRHAAKTKKTAARSAT